MFALPSFLAPAALYARLLNALLQREDWARARLYPHAGKTVRFVIGPVRISLCIDSSGFTQVSDPAVLPDVSLTLPAHQLSSLPTLFNSKDPSALTAILHIEGDAGLAQTVSDLARDLRWDIEHELATKVGDVAAMRLLQTGSSVLRHARISTQNLTENMGEYLAHESGLLTNRPAFMQWTGTLADAHQRIDHLESRVSALAMAAPPGRHTTTPPNRPAPSRAKRPQTTPDDARKGGTSRRHGQGPDHV